MNPKVIVLLCAVPLGLAGGYGWSVMTAPAPRVAAPPKPKMVAIPPSPTEYPEPGDAAWSERSDDKLAEVRAHKPEESVRCKPGKVEMDGDGDGIACTPHRAAPSNEG